MGLLGAAEQREEFQLHGSKPQQSPPARGPRRRRSWRRRSGGSGTLLSFPSLRFQPRSGLDGGVSSEEPQSRLGPLAVSRFPHCQDGQGVRCWWWLRRWWWCWRRWLLPALPRSAFETVRPGLELQCDVTCRSDVVVQ